MSAQEAARHGEIKVRRLYRTRVHEAVARGDLASARFWRRKAGEWARLARN